MTDQAWNHKVRIDHAIQTFLQTEGRRFVLWLPVLMGVGIWLFFAPQSEPEIATGWIWIAPLAGAILLRRSLWMRATMIVYFTIAAGYGLAMWSAHRADAPQVRFPVGETVEGRLLEVSRSASGAPRVLLDRLVIYGIEPERTPARVRLTILDGVLAETPPPGTRIRTYATLMPTGDPVEPGAFDFRRRAFFERLGGVGLVRGAVLQMASLHQDTLWDRAFVWLQRQRDAISRSLRDSLPGRQGAFAAAIIVGDRAGIGDEDAEALRASNLAHLLAISGLHMGILTGLIFGIARLLFAASPWFSLNYSTKKAAAITALCVGAAYLGLSGATVATQRAFIMVAVAFTAVLVDRPALTLRALALAAIIVLILRPISLLDAGFQMSFAATAALVSGFEYLRNFQTDRAPKPRGWLGTVSRIVLLYVGGLIASSLLAGIATAPIAAYHFNRTAPYGLLSNMLALPVMGFIIAPAASIAAVLAPLGLEDIALRVMGEGIEQVLRTAHWVASLPGAVRMVPEAPPGVLALVALGGLWVFIWRGAWRLGGVLAVGVALILWHQRPDRPDILIAPGAKLIGIMTPEGRVLDHETTQSFAAKSWLRRDGDMADQAESAARSGLSRQKGQLAANVEGWTVHSVWNRNASAETLRALCQENTILIAKRASDVRGDCLFLGQSELARSGAIAIHLSEKGAQVVRALVPSDQRLWSRR